MTDEYQKATKELMQYVTQAVEFTKNQMPEVVAQLLAYDAKVAAILLACCVIGWFVALMVLLFAYANDSEAAQVFAWAAILLLPLAALGNFTTIVKIETAPKLYVLDELRQRIGTECGK